MTDAQALRLICEAALLEDNEAAELLHRHYDALPYDDDGKPELLLALAWLDPKDARARMADMKFWAHLVQTRIEHLCEAQVLNQDNAEGALAYSAITALLPDAPLKNAPRLQIQRYALALRSPKDYIAHPDMELSHRDPFLIARLWHHYPEAFWQRATGSYTDRAQAIGRFVLAQNAQAECLPGLIALYFHAKKSFIEGMGAEQEHRALQNALVAFEASPPDRVKALAPQALAALMPHQAVALAARVLRAAAQAEVDITTLLGDLPYSSISHRWAAQVRRTMCAAAPVPLLALESIRVLRGLALLQLLKEYLNKEPDPKKVRRAWHWLLRSGRIIQTSKADPVWRTRLHQEREALELHVRQSRRRRHILARSKRSK